MLVHMQLSKLNRLHGSQAKYPEPSRAARCESSQHASQSGLHGDASLQEFSKPLSATKTIVINMTHDLQV